MAPAGLWAAASASRTFRHFREESNDNNWLRAPAHLPLLPSDSHPYRTRRSSNNWTFSILVRPFPFHVASFAKQDQHRDPLALSMGKLFAIQSIPLNEA